MQTTYRFFFLGLFLLSYFSLNGFCASVQEGTAISVNGKVYVGKKLLKPGDKILPGQVVHTTSSGSAKIILSDKSVLDLAPSTTMRIGDPTSNTSADAELDVGRLRALVQKRQTGKVKFSVKTKASVLAVRGTQFDVVVSPNQNNFTQQVTVYSGQIDVRNAGGESIPLNPGNQLNLGFTNFRGDIQVVNPPKVVTLAPEALAKEFKVNSVEDHSFNQAVEVPHKTKEPTPKDGPLMEQPPSSSTPNTEVEKEPSKTGPQDSEKSKQEKNDGTSPNAKPTDSNSKEPGSKDSLPNTNSSQVKPSSEGGSSTIASVTSGMENQFQTGRGPASKEEGGKIPPPRRQDPPLQPPPLGSVNQLNPAVSMGLVTVTVTIR